MARKSDFEDVIRSLLGDAVNVAEGYGGRAAITSTPPGKQIAGLRGTFADYRIGAKGRFKPGDIVAPKHGHNIKGAGQPCIVLEVYDEPKMPSGDLKHNNSNAAGLYDMLILREFSGDRVAFFELAAAFEHYKG